MLKIEKCNDVKYDNVNLNDFEIFWNSNSPKYIGETLESLTEKYLEDEKLNNIPRCIWMGVATKTKIHNRGIQLDLETLIKIQKEAAIKFIEDNK